MGREKKYYYSKKTKKKVVEEYLTSSATMNELAKIHGILGSNTVSDWIRKYGHLTKKNVHKPMRKYSKSEREKRQRSYEQLQISCLEIDLDETRQRLEFYRCALRVINEIALEITEIDLLKKTGGQLSIRRAKRKS